MKRIDFQPVLFDTLKNYSKEKFLAYEVIKKDIECINNSSIKVMKLR